MTDKALPPSAPISVRPNPLLGMPLTAGGLLISLPKALDGGPTAPVYAAAAVVSALAPALVLLLSVTVGRGRITVRRGLHRTSVPLAELRSVTAEADAGRGPHTLRLESHTGARCRVPRQGRRRRVRQRLVAPRARAAPPRAVREGHAQR
ncbi:hypothetical protein, partial [Kitasatospora sp. NPDC059817]|uniref:hypothetical protein n=1 Tax=Kitasatospora sp. NPDC059817 TaxID=3346961 RepID=UPI003652CEE5